jgi:hypothetical protein
MNKLFISLFLVMCLVGFSMSSVSAKDVGSDTTCGITFNVSDDSGTGYERGLYVKFPDITYDVGSSSPDHVQWKYYWYYEKIKLHFSWYVGFSNNGIEKSAALNKYLDKFGSAEARVYFALYGYHSTCFTNRFNVSKGDTFKVKTDTHDVGKWYEGKWLEVTVYKNDVKVAYANSKGENGIY